MISFYVNPPKDHLLNYTTLIMQPKVLDLLRAPDAETYHTYSLCFEPDSDPEAEPPELEE